MTKKEELYQVWLNNSTLDVAAESAKIGLDISSAYKYVRDFKEKEKIERNKIASDIGARSKISSEGDIDFLTILKNEKNIRLIEFCDRMGMVPKEMIEMVRYYRSKGHEIGIVDDRVIYSTEPLKEAALEYPIGDKEIIFGVASDLHFGSRACQITALNDFGEDCRAEGVTDIFLPGDVLAGINVYRGQHEDIYAFNPAAQENSCIENLPKGFTWWCLGGNHDYDAMKHNGHNVIKSIAHKREDVNYLGFDQASLPLLPGVDAILWHPSGGVPYALSYRLQKGIETSAYAELMNLITGIKERPTLRFFFSGHLHIQLQSMFGPIFGAQCGTFEGQTNYLKRKGLIPNIGGYIIKARLDNKGMLREHEAKFKHYREIENDFENYKHTPAEEKPVEQPIFS